MHCSWSTFYTTNLGNASKVITAHKRKDYGCCRRRSLETLKVHWRSLLMIQAERMLYRRSGMRLLPGLLNTVGTELFKVALHTGTPDSDCHCVCFDQRSCESPENSKSCVVVAFMNFTVAKFLDWQTSPQHYPSRPKICNY